MIKFQQNCLKQEIGHFILRFINLLVLFGVRRNCLRVERVNQCIYKNGEKQIVVIIGAYHFRQLC
jgi:hypothetical protein